jgi:hypothetical protein
MPALPPIRKLLPKLFKPSKDFMRKLQTLLFLLTLLPLQTEAGEGFEKIRELCNSRFEGAYDLTVEMPASCSREPGRTSPRNNSPATSGALPGKFYLFCLDDHRVAGTLVLGSGLNSVVAFPFSAQTDDGSLFLSQYMPKAEDRFQNLLGPLELSLSLEALKDGKISGWMTPKNCTDEARLSGSRPASGRFPHTAELNPEKRVKPEEITGHYTMNTEDGVSRLKLMLVDGVVRVRVDVDGTGMMVRDYLDGPRWNGEAAFLSAMVPGALPPSGMLGQIRGTVRADGSLQLFYIDTLGVKGPYIATKR